MNTIFRIVLLGVLTAGLAACTSMRGGTVAGGQQRVLTLDQIERYGASNAYEAVRTLRPMWLQKRGMQSINFEGEIVVYYDNVRLGGVESLRSISTSVIRRMEFMSASTATQRWGAGHTHGAILVFARS
jgi:hypothetical protein